MVREDSRHRPVMEIQVSSLLDGEHPFTFDVPAEDLGLDERFVGRVALSLDIRRVAAQITLRGLITATDAGECDRCLEEIETDIEVPLRLFYREESHDRSREDEEGEEFRSMEPDQDSIVLDDEVRQAVMLAVPLKHLCRDDCKGICAGCGVDLNRDECRCQPQEVDPRWEKLVSLLAKENPQPAEGKERSGEPAEGTEH